MNLNNPLEILFTVILILGSIWIIEKIITGAFKTLIAAALIFGIIAIYTKYHSTPQKKNVEYRFSVNDLTDYELFKKKFDVVKKDAIKDIKNSYEEAKANR